jgi:uncharacterized repeat protein (TIGR01451 family)
MIFKTLTILRQLTKPIKLLNKLHFLSLFPGNYRCTFVMYSKEKHKHMLRSANYQIQNAFRGFLRSLAVLGLVITAIALHAQPSKGWEFSYGGPGEDQAEAILQTDDRGYIMAGWSESFGTDNDADVLLVRTDVDGQQLWSQNHDLGFQERAFDMDKTTNGYIIVGDAVINPLDSRDVLLMEVDLRGNILWWNTYDNPNGQAQGFSVQTTSDGGFIIAGSAETSAGDNDMYILRTDNVGTVVWETTYGGPFEDVAQGVIEYSDGTFLATGALETTNVESEIILINLDPSNGTVQWDYMYENEGQFDIAYDLKEDSEGDITIAGIKDFLAFALHLTPNGGTPAIGWEWQYAGTASEAYALEITNDGDIVIGGVAEGVDGINLDALLAKLSINDGSEIWQYTYGHPDGFDLIKDIAKRSTGDGFAMCGHDGQGELGGAITLINDFLLLKSEDDGLVRTNKVAGTVFFDINENNVQDGADAGLEDWLITLQGDDVTYYATTNEEGQYVFTADTGVYNLEIFPKNGYWAPSSLTVNNIIVTGTYNLVEIDLPVIAAEDCPELLLDLSAEAVIPCETNEYTVRYLNQGTTDATSVQARIILDRGLTFVDATAPSAPTVVDSLLIFNLPNLPQGEANTFTFRVDAECDVEDGTTFQVFGSIIPDEICEDTPGWDEASIQIDGYCGPTNVVFTLSNNGIGDLSAPLDYIVIEDDIMGLSQPIVLDPVDETMEIVLPANGSTYRIVAEQSPNHPGASLPTLAIERCGTNQGGTYSTGMVTMFPEDEQDPFRTVDVQESLFAGNDVNLKGYPFGYNGDTIAANVDIQYHIRFENTTDSVLKWIAIRDTLELDKLQLATLEAGSSSHPYDMEVYENGELKFKFYNTELQPGDKGFVQFKVSQQPDLAAGTEIFNRAELFIGADEFPFMSVQKRHIIGGADLTDFVIINDVNDPSRPQYAVTIAPNPFSESAMITVQGWELGQLQLQVFDGLGRRVSMQVSNTGQFELMRNDMTNGVYYFVLLHEGQMVQTGKVIVR